MALNKYLFIIYVILAGFAVTPLQGQTLKLAVQQNFQPKFELNNNSFSNTSTNRIKLLFYQSDKIPVELGLSLTTGGNSTVDYSYGISPAYIFFKNNMNWLKAGLGVGRYKLGKYQDEVALGATLEDEYHDYFKPYLEWDWQISNGLSVAAQTGYCFIRSRTRTVAEILDRWEDGSIRAYRTSENNHFYTSGFEFSLGVNISLYSK